MTGRELFVRSDGRRRGFCILLDLRVPGIAQKFAFHHAILRMSGELKTKELLTVKQGVGAMGNGGGGGGLWSVMCKFFKRSGRTLS